MELRAQRAIARPAEEVFALFADAENNPRWQKGMQSCVWLSEPPIQVGSTYQQVARFMGRPVRTTFLVTEYQPGRSITIDSIESTFPIQVRRVVIPNGPNACEVSAYITGGPEKGPAKWFEPLLSRAAQRSVDRDYDQLKALLESGAGG